MVAYVKLSSSISLSSEFFISIFSTFSLDLFICSFSILKLFDSFYPSVFTSELIFSSFMQFIINVSLFLHATLFVCIVLSRAKCETVFSKSVLSSLWVL